MKEKQKKALKAVKWFEPTTIEWKAALKNPYMRQTILGPVKLLDVKQSRKGVSAEEAFFMRSEKGKNPEDVRSLARFASLMWGQRYMAMMVKQWKEGIAEGLSFPDDFKREPVYIKELFMKCWEEPKLTKKEKREE